MASLFIPQLESGLLFSNSGSYRPDSQQVSLSKKKKRGLPKKKPVLPGGDKKSLKKISFVCLRGRIWGPDFWSFLFDFKFWEIRLKHYLNFSFSFFVVAPSKNKGVRAKKGEITPIFLDLWGSHFQINLPQFFVKNSFKIFLFSLLTCTVIKTFSSILFYRNFRPLGAFGIFFFLPFPSCKKGIFRRISFRPNFTFWRPRPKKT